MIIPIVSLGNCIIERFECGFDSEGMNISWELLILLVAYCVFEIEIYYVIGIVLVAGGLLLIIIIVGIIMCEMVGSQLC
jgi:uncharacterized membrane protein YGL010W